MIHIHDGAHCTSMCWLIISSVLLHTAKRFQLRDFKLKLHLRTRIQIELIQIIELYSLKREMGIYWL